MLTAGVTSIDERIWRIRVPLPGHSIGHINSYLVVGAVGVVVIDLPWRHDAALAALEHGIESTGHRLDEVRGVLLTHYHEDHAGAAGWIRARTSAPVYAADQEVTAMRARYLENGAPFEDGLLRWLDIVAAPSSMRRFAREQYRSLRKYGELIECTEQVVESTPLAIAGLKIQMVPTPGHTAGHCSYYEPTSSAVFSGDHLFAWGSANATTYPTAPGRPLRTHGRSSRRLLELDARHVLPGHGDALQDLDARVDEFAEAADRRQDELLHLCSTPLTVWELASRSGYHRPWAEFSPNSMLSIAGEVHAHLLELEATGRITSVGETGRLWLRTGLHGGAPTDGSDQ